MPIVIKKKSVGAGVKEALKVFHFGKETDGSSTMKDVLGGKGANLAGMSLLGLPVPPGFTFPCDLSVKYLTGTDSQRQAIRITIESSLDAHLQKLRDAFGYLPLLSVRSGARVSMPGMMDTILNVGITSSNLPEWEERLGKRSALDSYRRLIQMYSSVVLGVPLEDFESILSKHRHKQGCKTDAELTVITLSSVVAEYLELVATVGKFPDSIEDQVMGAIIAVFESWDNQRAKEYRKIHGYSDSWGTAVTVQAMVFGNMNEQSATGVVFTRNPSTGEAAITGEYLVNAQGEDVVAGIRTPEPLGTMEAWNPEVYSELSKFLGTLEMVYKDMQDVEFTVQDGKLFILQTRNGKRTPQAAVAIAVGLASEGVISKKEAIGRVTRDQVLACIEGRIDHSFTAEPNLVGIAAGGGVVSGVAVFTSDDAVNCKEPCILVRNETDPDDIAGMNASVGILTATGGLTSHAAVVARGMNKACVVGAVDLVVQNESIAKVKNSKAQITPGMKVTIDGASGRVWVGVDVPVVKGDIDENLSTLISWAHSETDTTPRFSFGPGDTVESMAKAMNGHSTVFVDTALLTPGDAPEGSMGALVKAIEEFSGSQVVLSMESLIDHLPLLDLEFLNTFGGVSPNTYPRMETLVSSSTTVKGKIIVTTPKGFSSDILVKAGIQVSGAVTTVADLLNMAGQFTVDDDIMANVFGTKEAFDTIVGMIESHTGKSLGGKPKEAKYWYQLF